MYFKIFFTSFLVIYVRILNSQIICPQLPLPEHITERTMCNAVAPHKDVDGFNIVNIGRFCLDMKCLGPCTPLGVHELIRRIGR